MDMADSAEILRIAALLETLILVRKVPIRRTEKALGLSNGYLARVFSGKIELKYRHILDILEAAGMEPRDFFELAYTVGGEPQPGDLVQKLSPVPEPQEMPSPDSHDFEVRVIELLVKFGVLEKASRPPKNPGANPKSGKKSRPGKGPKAGKESDPDSK